MRPRVWMSLLLVGCWVVVMAAGGCVSEQAYQATVKARQEAAREAAKARYRSQPHPLAIYVEEGLAKPCTASDKPDLADSKQNYYVRYNNKFIRARARVVNARMADRKEPPITLGKGAVEAKLVKSFEREGFAIQSADSFEHPDYVIKYNYEMHDPVCVYYSSVRIYSGQGKFLYEMPWHRSSAGIAVFLRAKMMKGELDIKSEKCDALMESLRHWEVGQDEQALALLNKAVELDAKFMLARGMRRDFFIQTGRWDDAIKESSQILSLSLTDRQAKVAAYLVRGELYYLTEAFDAALKDFEQVLALDPKNVRAFVSKGQVLLQKKELDKAADAFEYALALDPDNVDAIAGRGWVLAKRQKYTEALKELDRVQAAEKRATRGHVYCYKMLGEKEKARGALVDVLEAAAKWPKSPLHERYKAELQEWAKELE